MSSDDLSLTVGGHVLSGWEEVEFTRTCEALPNSFRVKASQSSQGGAGAVSTLVGALQSIARGDAAAAPAAVNLANDGGRCTVKLGPDLALTGYVDASIAGYSGDIHFLQIQGRGRCQDLVDCSAEWPGFQIMGSSALDIASKLGAPYGITASCIGSPGPAIPKFNIGLGETPADVLEQICRFSALLYYEGPDGNLLLSQVGKTAAASGVAEGVNVQAASWSRSTASRYSIYKATNYGFDTSGVIQPQDGLFKGQASDPNVLRNRKLYIVDGGIEGVSAGFLQTRALWEAARRYGRSRLARVTVDSWRDKSGKLWTPNTVVPVSLPRLGLSATKMVLAEVTYRAAIGSGKTADLVLMPPEAFMPQPIMLQPFVPGPDPTPKGA